MSRWIVVLLIVVPALEIWTIITIGKTIGGWQTFALIVLTGLLGTYLAKREAEKVWRDARVMMAAGQVPGRPVLDGLCVFAGGLLLLTPGFLTDVAGFLLLFPLTRLAFRQVMERLIRKKLAEGRLTFWFWR